MPKLRYLFLAALITILLLTTAWAGVKYNKTNAPRTATIVVAAYNSSPQSKAQADYICDGVDDHIELQLAIDSLPEVGGDIDIREGWLNLYEDIIGRSNIDIEGANKVATLLRYYGDGVAIDFLGKKNFTLSNFTLTDFGEGISGIQFGNVGKVENVKVSGFQYGIEPAGGSGSWVKDCMISYCTRGINIDGGGHVHIEDNNIAHCFYGIMGSTHHSTISGNTIIEGGYGIRLEKCSNTIVSNNTFWLNKGHSVYLRNGTHHCLVTNNIIEGCLSLPIYEYKAGEGNVLEPNIIY